MIIFARSPKTIAQERLADSRRAYADVLREGQNERWLDAQADTAATEAWKVWMAIILKGDPS